jgi:hypothetical protein
MHQRLQKLPMEKQKTLLMTLPMMLLTTLLMMHQLQNTSIL